MPGPSVTELLYRDRWRTAVVAAILVGGHGLLDLRYPSWRLAVAVRAVWVGLFVGAFFLQRGGARRRTIAGNAVVFGSGAACAWIVAATGGSAGPRFGILLALPLAMLLLVPDLPWSALTLGLVSCGAGVAVLLAERREPWFVGEWVILYATVAAIVGYGAYQLRRMQAAERRAVGERTEALARLVDSERRREQADRLALAGRIATGVAHEINNPLSFVKASLAALEARGTEHGPTPEEERELLREARHGVERIAQIVADMRSLARDGAETIAPCDAEALVHAALRAAGARLAGLRVDHHFEPGLPPALADPRALVQALVQVLLNAADAVGQVSPERRWVRITCARSGERVHLSVADGGPGLAPDAERHLFEPFYSTKGVHGTGLGLAVTREQVHRCGGTLEARNAPEGGAVFTISLPAAGGARA